MTTLKFYTNIKNNNIFNNIMVLFDLILLVLVISFFIHDLWSILFSIIDRLFALDFMDSLCNMSSNASTSSVSTASSATNETKTIIIHDSGNISNSIRSLFIYGTGALRWQLARSGSPGSRAFVIVTTIGGDMVSRAVQNAINDPSYINRFWSNVTGSWTNKQEGAARVDLSQSDIDKLTAYKNVSNTGSGAGSTTSSTSSGTGSTTGSGTGSNTGTSNFISDNNLDELYNKLLGNFLNSIKSILEPVSVSYSNEVLADQIYGISILLFILSIFIIILFIVFILNVLLSLFSDRIMNYFTNKYIRWYISFNKKIINIEIIVLGGTILYFLYNLSYGIHFIATHPIKFS